MSSSAIQNHVQIGLAGLGTVGGGVFANLLKNKDLLSARTGSLMEVKKVAVRDLTRARDVEVPEEMLTGDWRELVADPDIDIIVELMGGTEQALELAKAALKAGKTVVTGNKALLAEHGLELIALAEQENVPLYCEAAVAGGIPIIKAIGEALVGNEILSIHGIINGTSNYILTEMTDGGLTYEVALDAAQRLGYAEADPALDINGWDAAHKAIILAWLSYGSWVNPDVIKVEGIEGISAEDIAFARDLGYQIKLIAVVKPHEGGEIEVRVGPSLVSSEHILASVNGVFNALVVKGDVVGETLFYGSGAGRDATSSSVIADLADAAGNLASGTGFQGFVPRGEFGKAVEHDATVSRYYFRLEVADEPGVIAKISSILGKRDIGILSVIQPGADLNEGSAQLVFMTHDAAFGNVSGALDEIKALACVRTEPVFYRVENLGA